MAEKSEEINTLLRRFDFVKKMYFSDKVIAANKKDLIFNWFLEQFGNHENHKKSSYIHELLWKTFHEILKKENQSSSRNRILIKSNAAINLLNAVANYPFSSSWAYHILSSVAVFLQTPTVNATLITDIDTMFLLLIATLKVICRLYNSASEDVKSCTEAKNLCNVILNILENLSASTDVEKILLLSESLQDVALFMHIAESDKELDDLSEKLAKKIVSIIFNLKNKQYETLLTPVDASFPVERPNTYILQFFMSLHNMLMNEDIIIHSIAVNAACATLMKKLLTAFLVHNKSSLHYLKIMSLFFAAAGLDVPIVMTARTCCNSLFKDQISNSEVLLLGLSHLLEACRSVPQYFTSMTVPEGYLKPSTWLKGVSAALLDAKITKNKPSWLNCFQSLVLISPSVIVNDVHPLIKIVLLNTTVRNAESKKKYCELFHVVLGAHSKLHQVPKFFVNLLLAVVECIQENSGGKLLVNGQVLPEVQESVAKCVQELPYGQMISLWEIFIQTFSTLDNMSEAFGVSKGFVFFVAQLFSIVLQHAQLFQANIPSNIYSQFSGLIENTSDEIKKNISSLKESDNKFILLQSSVLLLCYAIGEVKLAYNAYYGKPAEISETGLTDDVFDFSLLHSFFGNEYVSVLETHINGDDKMLSALVFQLLLQKIKALQFKESFSEENKSQMKILISVVLKHLQESSSGCEPWDMDISTITAKNYGTVYWKMFFKVAPLVISHLDPKDFYDLCHLAQSVILQDERANTGAKSIILTSLNSEFFQESNLFQTAFLSVIWKQENLLYSKKRLHSDMEAGQSSLDKIFQLLNAYHSKALKYAKRTPKSNKNLGNIWNEITEISDLLNDMLLTESLPREKIIIDRTSSFIKLLNSLPLDYLLPANQMKCIIGLSLLFFLIPQSCKSADAVSLAKDISSVLISIFEGVRSIWLFDFVASGPYLKYIVKTVDSVISVESDGNHDWAMKLIEHLVRLIVKRSESINAIEQYISELPVTNKCSQATLIIQCALLQKLSQVISRPYMQEKYKQSLIRISSSASEGFIKQMKQNFEENTESNTHSYFIKCYTYVIEIICTSSEVDKINAEYFDLFPVVLGVALNKVASSSNDVLSGTYLQFISKVCKFSVKLSQFLSEDFITVSWKIILSHFEEKRKKKKKSLTAVENLQSDFNGTSSVLSNNLCKFCSSYSKEKLLFISDEGSKTGEDADLNDKTSSPLTLSEFEEESLKELSTIASDEKLAEIFQDILNEMSYLCKREIDVFSLQMYISIFQWLIDVNSSKCNNLVLNQSIQSFVSHLSYIANETCSSAVCQVMVLIPIQNFMSFIVKGNKSLPRQVLFQSLHCVAPASLKVHNDDYTLYVKAFTASWNIVYNLFMHHTAFILPFPAPFLSYVAKLLKSVVRAGAIESLSKCDANIYKQVQLCAQNMNRLLTVITRNKTEFSKLAPYLVADYVDAIQCITLDSSIKESVLSGIHRLLDICSDDSIKMQSTNISYVCREIYGNLVKNYKQNKHMSAT